MNYQLHKIIRLCDLPQYCGLQRSQIEQLIAEGKFPRPVKLSPHRKGWLQAELIAWQQQRIAQRDAAPPSGPSI
jgi:prophage regulatory protein